jgi:hypothetical protein
MSLSGKVSQREHRLSMPLNSVITVFLYLAVEKRKRTGRRPGRAQVHVNFGLAPPLEGIGRFFLESRK